MLTRKFIWTTFLWAAFVLFMLALASGLLAPLQATPRAAAQEALSPAGAMALNTPTATVPPGTVTIQGHIYYTAQNDEDNDDVTNHLARVHIEVWDDTGVQALGTTWADYSGYYSISVPNNEPGGIDPSLRIFVDDFGKNPPDSRVQVVNTRGIVYEQGTMPVGTDLSDGTYPFDFTFTESNSSEDFVQAMYIFDLTANKAYNYLQGKVQWNNTASVQINWPKQCAGIPDPGDPDVLSCFWDGEIYIHQLSGDNPDVIIHEYAHFVQAQYLDASSITWACYVFPFTISHRLWVETDPDCAYIEGWADFFEMAVQNDPDYNGINDLENVDDRLQNDVIGDPESYEGVVAASLWDFKDGTNEDW